MITVKAALEMSFAGVSHEEILKFNDDATNEEIEEAVVEWAMNQIDIGWNICD